MAAIRKMSGICMAVPIISSTPTESSLGPLKGYSRDITRLTAKSVYNIGEGFLQAIGLATLCMVASHQSSYVAHLYGYISIIVQAGQVAED
jgi:hypothetical protein